MRPYIGKSVPHPGSGGKCRTLEQRIRHWLECARECRRVELNPNNWREYLEQRRSDNALRKADEAGLVTI